ncbi:hypothetical protein LXL04_014988 [Taraxacum kok-saghyz]
MYVQRHGLCCFILVQHSLEGDADDEMAAAHGASWVGLQVTATPTSDWAKTMTSNAIPHIEMYDEPAILQ